MAIEWDIKKNKINIEKHVIDYKEKRWIGIGKLEQVIVVLVYTIRGNNIRIISIRKANKIERKIYNEHSK
jgi:uncharacterized DUF497 family protein